MSNENKKREEFFEKALNEFLQQYMNENAKDEERIISYEFRGYGSSTIIEHDSDIGTASVNFVVEPYSKENTIWTNSKEWINNGAYTCYIKYKKVEDEYVVERISTVPENYEEFMIEFEKYKSNLPEETIKKETVQEYETKNYLANQEIQAIDKGIYIGCGIALVIAICMIVKIVFSIHKHKKNKKY